MSVNCQHLAIAIASRVAFEQMCRRERLIDEAMIKRTAAEALQAMTQLDIEAEYNHSDLPGSKRLDLIGRTRPDVPLSLVAELKWVKAGGGVRDWLVELAEAALRLETLLEETTSAATERLLVICGISQTIESQLLNRERNVGKGRIKALEHIVPVLQTGGTLPANQEKIAIRDCNTGIRKLWSDLAKKFGKQLPVSYQASLAAHYRVDHRPQSIRVFVWLVRRSRNRSTFDPTGTWP